MVWSSESGHVEDGLQRMVGTHRRGQTGPHLQDLGAGGGEIDLRM